MWRTHLRPTQSLYVDSRLSSLCIPCSWGVPDSSDSFNPSNSLSAVFCELGLMFVRESLHLLALVAQWSFSDDDWTRPNLGEFFFFFFQAVCFYPECLSCTASGSRQYQAWAPSHGTVPKLLQQSCRQD